MGDERNPRDKTESEECGERSQHDVADEVLGLEDNEDQNEDEDEEGEDDETIIP